MQDIGSLNPSGNLWFFFYSFIVFFFFCQETIYRKVAFVFSFLAWKNSLELLIIHLNWLLSKSQYHIGLWRKNHEDYPGIESLRKNHKYFPYNEKLFIPSMSKTTILVHCKQL